MSAPATPGRFPFRFSAVQRVSVQGVPGSGKSTVGRAIAARLGVRFTELDALHWGPGWSEPTTEDFLARVTPLVAEERWVIDGRYHGKLGDLVIARADTVVWLDLPIRVWLPRLVLRTLRRMVWREELWNGNRESVRDSLELFQWAWQKHRDDRTFVPRWVAAHPQATLVRLRSPREVDEFIERLGP
jgi:adenylate kinase family enzyme